MLDLTTLNWAILLVAVFAVAFFYSSVGHGGASGYLAALALLGIAPVSARVAVLIANVLVASIAWWQFWRAGHFDCRVLLSFVVISMPCAWLGSRVHISKEIYEIILGAVLAAAGSTLLLRARWQTEDVPLQKFCSAARVVHRRDARISRRDLTGIGGGVFLSPMLYVFRWVKPKTTGGIAAGFIVLNSIAGLAGTGWEKITHAGPLLWLTVPAVIGALLGTHFGARRWNSVIFSRVLAGILIFSGGKLLIAATG